MNTDDGAWFAAFDWSVTPWVLMLLFLIPLLLLAWLRRVYPTSRLAVLFCIPLLLSIFVPWTANWWLSVVFAIDGAVAVLAIIDGCTLPKVDCMRVERTMPRVASLGGRHPVELTIDNRGRRPLRLVITDDAADGLTIEPACHRIELAPGKRTIVSHTVTPHRRGLFELEFIFAHIQSAIGLWCKQHAFPCAGQLHVYPDIKQIAEYALLARTNRLNLIGVRKTRRAGHENNFERLRDYQPDDNYRHIDWRSTARRQKLTVKQFQADQSQRVIFLLDCGRMMTNEYDGLSLVDYALNSILMLSYVALEQGDSVGMLCFSDHIHTYVPPLGGKHQMQRLLHAGFNQFPRLVQSRFDTAFLYLSTHCRRRSLVVLVSNVIDQVNSQQIHNYMSNLIGCHLPLLVLLRDHRVFESADNPSPDPMVMYRSAAASQILLWRHQVIRRLQATGTFTLDVFPEQMTSPLVNQYLEIKARHLL